MAHPPRWILIVLRAWMDGEGVRVRVLGTDSEGAEAAVVAASPEQAAQVVQAWLADLAAGTGPQQDVDRRRKT